MPGINFKFPIQTDHFIAFAASQEHLIYSCAPVFMGVKPAAFMRLDCKEVAKLQKLSLFCPINIQTIGQSSVTFGLIYIPQLLERVFRMPGVLYLLRSIGYGGDDVEDYVIELIRRIRGAYENKNLFPHEIGIFLGYPLEDVLGFWMGGGKNAKKEGEWKVYSDIERAEEIQFFHQKAVEVVMQAVKGGDTLEAVVKYFWNVQ